jgi:hypothetical protein
VPNGTDKGWCWGGTGDGSRAEDGGVGDQRELSGGRGRGLGLRIVVKVRRWRFEGWESRGMRDGLLRRMRAVRKRNREGLLGLSLLQGDTLVVVVVLLLLRSHRMLLLGRNRSRSRCRAGGIVRRRAGMSTWCVVRYGSLGFGRRSVSVADVGRRRNERRWRTSVQVESVELYVWRGSIFVLVRRFDKPWTLY